jgi:hypothetical protein
MDNDPKDMYWVISNGVHHMVTCGALPMPHTVGGHRSDFLSP